jgi:methylenetetrahydrofolate reductase (NADPH)
VSLHPPWKCWKQVSCKKQGIRKIGVSGHPEGSPDINDNQLAEALAWKNDYAKKEGLELYIETQFCFDAEAVVAWEKRIRADGNMLPIRIGIPGPATIKTLFRFAQISGIGPSMRFIAKQARNVTKLLTGSITASVDCRSCRSYGQ